MNANGDTIAIKEMRQPALDFTPAKPLMVNSPEVISELEVKPRRRRSRYKSSQGSTGPDLISEMRRAMRKVLYENERRSAVKLARAFQECRERNGASLMQQRPERSYEASGLQQSTIPIERIEHEDISTAASNAKENDGCRTRTDVGKGHQGGVPAPANKLETAEAILTEFGLREDR